MILKVSVKENSEKPTRSLFLNMSVMLKKQKLVLSNTTNSCGKTSLIVSITAVCLCFVNKSFVTCSSSKSLINTGAYTRNLHETKPWAWLMKRQHVSVSSKERHWKLQSVRYLFNFQESELYWLWSWLNFWRKILQQSTCYPCDSFRSVLKQQSC